MLHIPYQEQLQKKQAIVEDLFKPYLTKAVCIHPVSGMDNPYYYRNKVVSPFVYAKKQTRKKQGTHKGKPLKPIACGMYAKGTHTVIDTSECLIENKLAKRIIMSIRSLMYVHDIEPYDEDRDVGFMRHAQIRIAQHTGEVMVTLVTRDDVWKYGKSFARALVKKHPEITTVIQNINTANNNVILGKRERTLYGPGFILDTLCGLSFRLSSTSFYQVNVEQAQHLYESALAMAHLTGNEVVLDAYCGTGTIGLAAVSGIDGTTQAKHLIGVEERADAVADARMNARHNGIVSAEFIAADASAYMKSLARETADSSQKPIDVLFMDPPRAGATPEFLKATTALAPKRIVYISCNPHTQIRDVKYLLDHGYMLKELHTVDMFPHTDGIENIVSLELCEETSEHKI